MTRATHSSTTMLVLSMLGMVLMSPAFCQSVPYDLSAVRSALDDAKLQIPETSNSKSYSDTQDVKPLEKYSSSAFSVRGGKYMQFKMSGSKRRSELREMQGGKKAAWSVKGSKIMKAAVAVPVPNKSVYDEITFLQLHCGSPGPAVRVYWTGDIKDTRNGKKYSNVFGVTVQSAGKKYAHYKLNDYTTSTVSYTMSVKGSKLYIKAGSIELKNISLKDWEGEGCYFKAGLYITRTNKKDESVSARTEFRSLSW